MQLPFIIIQAGQEARVELQLSDDSTEVHFDFHGSPFRIHGDDTLLKLMDLDAKPQLPRSSASGDAAGCQLGSGSQPQGSFARGPIYSGGRSSDPGCGPCRHCSLTQTQEPSSPRPVYARLGSTHSSAAGTTAADSTAAGGRCDATSNKRRRLQSITPVGPPLTVDASAGTSPWPNELFRSLNIATWSPTLQSQGGFLGPSTDWPTSLSSPTPRPNASGASMTALLQAPPPTPPALAQQAVLPHNTKEASPSDLIPMSV